MRNSYKYSMRDFHYIDPKLIVEMTLPELERSAVSAFPRTTKRQHATDTVTVTGIMMVPMKNAVMVKAEVRNADGGKVYDAQVLVEDVIFKSKDDSNVVSFTGSDGNEYFVEPIDLQRAQVKVTCNCLDFYWRFASWNSNKGSLLGQKPAPYIKKTQRPPANPKQLPGVCKHLMRLLADLKGSNIFKH